MENLCDSLEMMDKLRVGEQVICPECGKGIVVAVNKDVDPKGCHGFYCDNDDCNYQIHWDPPVVVE